MKTTKLKVRPNKEGGFSITTTGQIRCKVPNVTAAEATIVMSALKHAEARRRKAAAQRQAARERYYYRIFSRNIAIEINSACGKVVAT